MDWSDIVEVGVKALTALGGVGIVAAAVAKAVSSHTSQKWLQDNQGSLDQALETHRAELAKQTEAHKLSLKRQELLFARELEAADAFMTVWRKVWPQYSHPEMDWDDACENAALRLGSIEAELEDYLEKHSVAISASVRDLIDTARWTAASEKFFETMDPPKEAIKAAESALDAVKAARDAILSDLRR